MPIISDPRYTGASLVGEVRRDLFAPATPEEPALPLLDTLAAASRIAFLPGAAYDRIANSDWRIHAAPQGYDPLDHIDGFEDFASDFYDARSPEDVDGIKGRIQNELADRDTLRRAGIGGTGAQIALSALDPSFWVAMSVPEVNIARIARINRMATSAARGAVGTTIYEIGQQASHETRSLKESAFSITGGMLLGGILGSLTRGIPAAERATLRTALQDELTVNPDPSAQSFGAAAVRAPTTLEAESLAAGGDRFSRLVGKIPLVETDAQRILRSDSVEARTALQDLAEVTPTLNKNLEGIATPVSVESLAIRQEGRIGEFAAEMKRLYRAHRVDPRPALVGAPRLSRAEFEAAVASAARNADRDIYPHVREAARYLRAKVFDPLKVEAQRLGLLPADAEIDLFADSYFRRMYDRAAIRARRGDWDAVLSKHFRGKGLDVAEAKTAADDITRRILGADVGQANFNIRAHVPNAGPLHERVLDIRDELIEPFLVNDPVKVASAYVRELAPQIEVIKKFGDKDMRDALQRVRDEYGALRVRASVEGNQVRVNALNDQERETLEAITRIRDRIYGRAGTINADTSIGARRMSNVLRGWRNLVASAKLGMTALTGGANDLSRIVATEGFAPTMKRISELVSKPAFRELSRANARRLGVATEVALARRVAVASDGAITEGWTQRLADATYRVSGLNHATDFLRTVSATLIEDKILGAAADVAGGRLITKSLRADLARIGIDTTALKQIHVQVQAHGASVDGISTSGSMQWTDGALAEIYDAAIVKEARTLVLEPGAANRTWWADGEVGKTLGQIKSFSLASPLKLTLTPIQLVGQGRYVDAARFVGAMMIGGALVHVLRQTAAGVKPATDPKALAGEAFAESGLAGILPDLVSPFARRFGILGESARFADRNVTSAFGGPAVGTAADLYDLIYNRTSHGLSASDLHALRRLLPLNQIWWLRRGINALEGETAEALGLPGATAQTLGERALESRSLASSAQRGGTGTGSVVQ
jgi:hypothetical protein